MIKIVASYGLKLPAEQQYSSESFHATAEVEVADSLANKPGAMQAALHSLWDDLKQAVAQEIRRNGGNHAAGSDGNRTGIRFDAPADRLAFNAGNGRPSGNGRPHPRTSGNGNGNGNGNGDAHQRESADAVGSNGHSEAASRKQVGFILALCRRKKNQSAHQVREWLRSERGLSLNNLTKHQAAQVIDELNA